MAGADIHFYHLQRQPLEAVLPVLLGRSRERGWRALVKVGSEDRMAALDGHLWSFSEESFLAHGTDQEPEPAAQPVLLTLGDANPNGAAILFLAEGVGVPETLDGYERVVILIEGGDEDAVAAARETWRRLRGGGHAVTYWQQDDDGRWRNKA